MPNHEENITAVDFNAQENTSQRFEIEEAIYGTPADKNTNQFFGSDTPPSIKIDTAIHMKSFIETIQFLKCYPKSKAVTAATDLLDLTHEILGDVVVAQERMY